MGFNLTEGLNASFTFGGEIEGVMHQYEAFYPTAKQLRPLQLGYARLKEIDKELSRLSDDDVDGKKKLEKEIKKIGDEMATSFNEMFKPIGDSMPISDFIDNLPVPAKKNFDNMVANELLGA